MMKKLVKKDATNRPSYKYIQNFKTAMNKQKDADPKQETTEGKQMHASK